ncbi:hypothetical protein KL86DYS1_20294 [uncultured Dysgonomonas sp.]|uniref:Uncharacterized protein n=1 Tax=uncultured Dysgonomonas sp. TaxID=206096 RepID=A0A212JN37_9BACT|nr:hypothetical protein KL86DYS1_20294 [uncultured Dysgonomonas sp.]
MEVFKLVIREIWTSSLDLNLRMWNISIRQQTAFCFFFSA